MLTTGKHTLSIMRLTLPNDKILRCSKLKAFADNKTNVNKKLKFGLGRMEKHCKKRKKILVTSIFSFSYNVFKRLLPQGHYQRTEGPESRTDGETLIFWD